MANASQSDPISSRTSQRRQSATSVRRVLREEPELWLQLDPRNRWFCPHCGDTVNSIVLPPGTARALLPDLPHQIIEHLSACTAVKAGLPADKRLQGNSASTSSALHQAMHDARLRQRHTLRKPPALKGYEIGCLFRPMEAVGGDFYEFIELPDGKLGIGIGDASGHGVEACMLTAVTKKLLTVFGRNIQSPGSCLCAVNREIFDDVMLDAFISAEYAILDPANKQFTYARAGHPPPLIFNPKRSPQVVQLNCNGLALGVDPGIRFDQILEEISVTLQPGDLLIMYTDGFVELPSSPDGDEIGVEGLVDVLRKYYDRRLDDIVGQVWHKAEKLFREFKQPDDITMVALKVLP